MPDLRRRGSGPEPLEDATYRLVRRRAGLQRQLRQAKDAIAYSRVLLDIAWVNRQLATTSGVPAHHGLGFLKTIGESPGEQSDPATS